MAMQQILNPALILPLGTALGAFGGFPEAPMWLQNLQQNEWFRYFSLFVLIWQGGAGQNVQRAAFVTLIVAAVIYMSRWAAPAPAPAAEGMGCYRK